ncbi:MAG: hypothetical protein A2W03_16905 [Candidatus Aminicenantes bacterium RBG_16_63_16]|nr:MAG: hypothetical protein A2W03_16905 [Candidatus Aminicenantes bacterium RBG_16_63_16]
MAAWKAGASAAAEGPAGTTAPFLSTASAAYRLYILTARISCFFSGVRGAPCFSIVAMSSSADTGRLRNRTP